MKKWGILVVVVLGGLLLVLQYFTDKDARREFSSSGPGQEQPIGVALPPSATFYAAPQTSDFYPGGTESSESLPQPAGLGPYTGACEGGSLEEMRASFGTYWGIVAPNSPFLPADTDKMYELMNNYVGCLALARNDINLCDSLPTEPKQDGVEPPDAKLRRKYACRGLYGPLLDTDSSGNVKSIDSCYTTLPDGRKEPDLSRLECKIALKRPRGPMRWPTSKAACAGDTECLNMLSLHLAAKSGKVSECPRTADRRLCEALITRSERPCEELVRDMSKFYCAAVVRAKKANGGFIGVSQEEIKAIVARKKLEQAEADRRKQEDEKTLADLNKNVRQKLKKK